MHPILFYIINYSLCPTEPPRSGSEDVAAKTFILREYSITYFKNCTEESICKLIVENDYTIYQDINSIKIQKYTELLKDGCDQWTAPNLSSTALRMCVLKTWAENYLRIANEYGNHKLAIDEASMFSDWLYEGIIFYNANVNNFATKNSDILNKYSFKAIPEIKKTASISWYRNTINTVLRNKIDKDENKNILNIIAPKEKDFMQAMTSIKKKYKDEWELYYSQIIQMVPMGLNRDRRKRNLVPETNSRQTKQRRQNEKLYEAELIEIFPTLDHPSSPNEGKKDVEDTSDFQELYVELNKLNDQNMNRFESFMERMFNSFGNKILSHNEAMYNNMMHINNVSHISNMNSPLSMSSIPMITNNHSNNNNNNSFLHNLTQPFNNMQSLNVIGTVNYYIASSPLTSNSTINVTPSNGNLNNKY